MTILERAQLSQLRVKYALGLEMVGDELKILLRLESERNADADGRPSVQVKMDQQTLTPD